jgi:glucokinase
MHSSACYVGVDIGGTKVGAGIVNREGEILWQSRVPMVSDAGAKAGLNAVRRAIDAVMQSFPGPITAIGLSCPGPLNPVSGVVLNPPNLPCWRNFPLRKLIEEAYCVPVFLDNDANAAALAEGVWGAAKDYNSCFYATIGTGIGTGIILDRLIHRGRTGSAAEGGHLVIDYRQAEVCGCGKRGCIESLASGPAIARRARAKAVEQSERGKTLLELARGDIENITAEMVGQAWNDGDALATEVLRDTTDLLAVWLGNIIDLIEPEIIVVGGGVGELISHFFERIRSELPKWSINQRCCEIPLTFASYGSNSGIAGAAALCM